MNACATQKRLLATPSLDDLCFGKLELLGGAALQCCIQNQDICGFSR